MAPPRRWLVSWSNCAGRCIGNRRWTCTCAHLGTGAGGAGGAALEVSVGGRLSSGAPALRDGRPGPVVLLRANMNALPVREDTGLNYASRVRVWLMSEEGGAEAAGRALVAAYAIHVLSSEPKAGLVTQGATSSCLQRLLRCQDGRAGGARCVPAPGTRPRHSAVRAGHAAT
jgi:hypothetical protein